MIRALAVIFSIWSFAAMAQDTRLDSLETGDDARGWEAVGRLDIEGKGFCTGALISERLVLTAAHCMYDSQSLQQVDPALITFQMGLRNGRSVASRGVRRAAVHPEYVHTGRASAAQVRYDLALIELDRPVRLSGISPFRTAPSVPRGTKVGVVSYARGRAEAPSLQKTCSVLNRRGGVITMSCDVTFGSSGAPVFLVSNGIAQIVSVVSATGTLSGEQVSFGVDLSGTLDLLRSELAIGRGTFSGVPPAGVRVIRPGERNDTGARFITVGE